MDQTSTPTDVAVDWTSARRFLQSAVRAQVRRLQGLDAAETEDLTQEACVRTLRALRREEVHNLDALMNDIARKTVIDHLRKRSRWRAMTGRAWDWDPAEATPRDAWPIFLDDPVERTRFVVLAWFKRNSPRCHQLAVHYFSDGHTWEEIGAKLDLATVTVRQRWSRCVGVLRKEVRGDRDFLWKWAQDSRYEEGPSDGVD